MLTERRADTVRVWAPAKVNLFLEVLAKRDDGYHDIATLMVAVSLYDILEFREDQSREITLQCDCPELSTGPENLVLQAAHLLQRRTGDRRGVHIRLWKRIPLAAGLAGGSTDAAATLVGLNRCWRLGLTLPELARLGAELGSDVPFFFSTPAAWCTGRGDSVTSQALAKPLWFVLVRPAIGLSTAEVYRRVEVPAKPRDGGPVRAAAAAGDIQELGKLLHNRLQPAAEQLCPEVAAWHARLLALRPAGQLMSGSGSSLFALCHDRRDALRLVRGLQTAWGVGKLPAPSPRVGMEFKALVRSCS